MYEKPKLSIWEIVTLLGAGVRVLTTVLGSSLTAYFRGKSGAATYSRHVVYTALRVLTTNTTIRQSQAFSDTTVEAYIGYAKSRRFVPQVVDIGCGVAGCWVGNKNADTVIVWFHGGGYVLMGNNGHYEVLWNLILKAESEGRQLAAFVLQYDTAPHATFPSQLIQASAALSYLTKESGLSTSQLIVGGDSAGGNLTLALISHILHPHHAVPTLDLASGSMKGVILLSPWVTFAQTAPAFKRNAKKDVLTGATLKSWSDAFIGDARTDNYNSPLDAPPDWWSQFPAKSILVLAGEDELFVDDIKDFAQKLRESNVGKTEDFFAAGECHDSPVLDSMLGFVPGKQVQKLDQWILKLLS